MQATRWGLSRDDWQSWLGILHDARYVFFTRCRGVLRHHWLLDQPSGSRGRSSVLTAHDKARQRRWLARHRRSSERLHRQQDAPDGSRPSSWCHAPQTEGSPQAVAEWGGYRTVAEQLLEARALGDVVRAAKRQRDLGDAGDGLAHHVFHPVRATVVSCVGPLRVAEPERAMGSQAPPGQRSARDVPAHVG